MDKLEKVITDAWEERAQLPAAARKAAAEATTLVVAAVAIRPRTVDGRHSAAAAPQEHG